MHLMLKKKNNNTIFLLNVISIKNEFEKISQNFFVDYSILINFAHKCRRCKLFCFFNNKLHKHLKTCRQKIQLLEFRDSIEKKLFKIILSKSKTNDSNDNSKITFRK